MIDYYEVDILPFSQQVYPGKNPAPMVGYDGMCPGPTFIVEKGRETVVRFTNKASMNSSVHLHGSYSVRDLILDQANMLTLEIACPLGRLGGGHNPAGLL